MGATSPAHVALSLTSLKQERASRRAARLRLSVGVMALPNALISGLTQVKATPGVRG
jgi:hypothetical protein